jgi:hypothetical protein
MSSPWARVHRLGTGQAKTAGSPTPTRTAPRLGVDYKQIPVNALKVPVHSYSKDRAMRVVNASDPVYAPELQGRPAG